jgi:hypothetical protein
MTTPTPTRAAPGAAPQPVATAANSAPDDSYEGAWGIDPSDPQDAARLKRIAMLKSQAGEGLLERATEYARAFGEANQPAPAAARLNSNNLL